MLDEIQYPILLNHFELNVPLGLLKVQLTDFSLNLHTPLSEIC